MDILDGQWRIAKDSEDLGKENQWFTREGFPVKEALPVQVPGNIWEVYPDYNGITWYSRTFTPEKLNLQDMRYYLHFDAVEYSCEVWLNECYLGPHEGAESSFEFDVTRKLKHEENFLVLRVFNPQSIFVDGRYPNAWGMGGIVRHVKLEEHPEVRILDVFARPEIKTGDIPLDITLENSTGRNVSVNVKAAFRERKGDEIGSIDEKIIIPDGQYVHTMKINLQNPHLWSLEDPFLYSIKVTLEYEGKIDEYPLPRVGFREFCIKDGYFCLNNKRLFLKCTHQNIYDPRYVQGTSRDMKYLAKDFSLLKSAGFNMFRFIVYSALPEQLEIADELGFLLYVEHQSSWLLKDAEKFDLTMGDVIKKSRNHPSVVVWGLLNETSSQLIYEKAKSYLKTLRELDDTRLVLLGSGRWDGDGKTGSGSNPGSDSWDVYLGGEDPENPVPTGELKDLGEADDVFIPAGGYKNGFGDAHVYHGYPCSRGFIDSFARLASDTKNIFVSEGGAGSLFNAFGEKRKLEEEGVPKSTRPWSWTLHRIEGLQNAWLKYDLYGIYPSIEEMLIDSQRISAVQRDLFFSIIRSNPKVNGYSLTSLTDAGGAGEGVMDNFREWKADHFSVLQNGWAGLRWCLVVNPANVYEGEDLHIRIALANEDVLPAGKYRADINISGNVGMVWQKEVLISIQGGDNPPFAYTVFDEAINLKDIAEGEYILSAAFRDIPNAASNEAKFSVLSKKMHHNKLGRITVLGLDQKAKDLLTEHGAILEEYCGADEVDGEAVIVGDRVENDSNTWRSLYKRIAKGAHLVFLSHEAFGNGTDCNKWLALSEKGCLGGLAGGRPEPELYHKEIVVKNHPFFKEMQTKIMRPDWYGNLLNRVYYFKNVTTPDNTAAAGFHCSFVPSYEDGVIIGTYNHHAGKFTINTLNIIGNLGNPAADRLLLNMAVHAKATAAAVQPLPLNYDAELDSLGITDR